MTTPHVRGGRESRLTSTQTVDGYTEEREESDGTKHRRILWLNSSELDPGVCPVLYVDRNSEWLLFGPMTEVISTPRFRDTFDHIHGFKCAV